MAVISDRQVYILLDPRRHLQMIPLDTPFIARLDDIQRRASIMHQEPVGAPPPANAVTVEELTALFAEMQATPMPDGAKIVINHFIEDLGLVTKQNERGEPPPPRPR